LLEELLVRECVCKLRDFTGYQLVDVAITYCCYRYCWLVFWWQSSRLQLTWWKAGNCVSLTGAFLVHCRWPFA